MDTYIAVAAFVFAALALAVAIDAYRRAGRGAGAPVLRAAPAPDRTPPPEFVKPAPSTAGSSRAAVASAATGASIDPHVLSRIDALEAQVAALVAEGREAPAPRRSSSKTEARSAESASDGPSHAARRVFP